ncbi:MAG: hypothetical protein M1383_04910 [Patescibacteria group bacterium]|nr:hypothetical protein [Patescibacteria group bacterium]
MSFIARNKFLNKYLPLILSAILLVTAYGAYFVAQKSKTAESAWFTSSSTAGTWNYRQRIVIDHTKVG